jgi:MoxR-like ATPase
MNEQLNRLRAELSKHIIGHKNLVDSLLIGLLSQGHILIEGVPGLAKTTAVNAISKALDLNFKRVQFTADLLPSDILGSEIYHPKTEEFVLKKGAIFTHLLLCDEINRASAKVQSALLEVMQEKQVTIGEHSFPIEEPFLVVGTQNPIDQEGTYALPEAQLDRFMLKVIVEYNSEAEEFEIAKKAANRSFEPIQKVITKDALKKMQQEVQDMYIDDALTAHIVKLIFATRDPEQYGVDTLNNIIEYGASPRATIDMIKAVKASAYLRGKSSVSPIDIALCFKSVLRHRIVLSYDAQAEEISVEDVMDTLIQSINID